MKLRDLVVEKAIIPTLAATRRDDAIAELLDALIEAKAVPASQREAFLKSAVNRERRGSTGFGHGVAVPHVKTPDMTDFRIAIGNSEEGIDFKSMDKQPVHSVVLLISPESRLEEHIDAMGAIFANLGKDQFRRFLRQATSPGDVLTLIEEADAGHAAG